MGISTAGQFVIVTFPARAVMARTGAGVRGVTAQLGNKMMGVDSGRGDCPK